MALSMVALMAALKVNSMVERMDLPTVDPRVVRWARWKD